MRKQSSLLACAAQIVMDWLGKLLGLPPSFLSTGSGGRGGGCIQGTASEAAVVALLAARSRALAGRPHEDHVRLVAYTSDQARVLKGMTLGLRRSLVRPSWVQLASSAGH